MVPLCCIVCDATVILECVEYTKIQRQTYVYIYSHNNNSLMIDSKNAYCILHILYIHLNPSDSPLIGVVRRRMKTQLDMYLC